MQSFRTELENPVVEKDILELEKKIFQFKNGDLAESSFRSLRLARGVYGQRQQGVQMVRIKLPLGIISPDQLRRIALIANEYSDGKLHLTTRQDIQIHHVSLERTPELWAELEKDDITLREACGNTVRNITASPYAGIDPEEPFDITPYGRELFQYFLRNPIGQELGRKFKIALSSSLKDQARSYMHDLGLIPVVQDQTAGFKVLIGGGLGAQPASAAVITDFLPAEDLLKFGEAIVKVFDRLGERNKRQKARLKFLIKEIGLEKIKSEIALELVHATAPKILLNTKISSFKEVGKKKNNPVSAFDKWVQTNVRNQKQTNYFSAVVRVNNGNLTASQTFRLADIIQYYSGESARLTIDQNVLVRSLTEDLLEDFFNDLKEIGLGDYGAGSLRDITSCPGTSTCNLGITSTYNVAEVIDKVLVSEFNELIFEEEISIKISGCMNACGQHSVADIGFHGSSFQVNGNALPALQVLLGGNNSGNGIAQFADKVIKVPTRRVEQVIRLLLNDFKKHKDSFETFNTYYNRRGKNYFYELLKPLADVEIVKDEEYLDWGASERFKTEIGVGECAGVRIDLAKTLLFEANEKLEEADYFFSRQQFTDAAYSVLSGILQTAKCFLLKKGIETNSKENIQQEFEKHFENVAAYFIQNSFKQLIETYRIAHLSPELSLDWIGSGKRFYEIITILIDKDENK